jgi:hypothetical protein
MQNRPEAFETRAHMSILRFHVIPRQCCRIHNPIKRTKERGFKHAIRDVCQGSADLANAGLEELGKQWA